MKPDAAGPHAARVQIHPADARQWQPASLASLHELPPFGLVVTHFSGTA
jgi:hypothetical protein